jgi:large subunit ribosomal protein L21
MYAIIETGGKQYRVEAGSTIQVEKLPGDVGSVIELDRVHLVHGEAGPVIGQPLVRRKNYRRTRGHRQGFTRLLVKSIAST